MSNWKEELAPMVSRITGCETLNYSHCDWGRERVPECMSAILEEASAVQKAVSFYLDPLDEEHLQDQDEPDLQSGERMAIGCLAMIRNELPAGYVAFMGTTSWLGEDRKSGIELVIGPGSCQFDILRHARTDACNYELQTEDIIRKLQDYDEQFGIDIFHAESDLVEFDLKTEPPDPETLAEDLYEFCPDLIDQGVGDLNDLAEELIHTRRISLWWD